MSRPVAAALLLATAGTLLLRTSIIHSGYWIDEAITVGIASHDLADIPRTLRLDGSPPLFYLLLHGWMALVGTGEAATRALPLLFALLAVPVSWWAGSAVCDRRAGALAAAGAAGCPFLTYYAQETRMYSLVAVLSVLACASFVLAFLRGRRGHVWLLGVWIVLLLYTHNWALFLVAGMGVAWLWLWHEGRVGGREGALLAAGVALLYAPWVPSLAFQAANTAAPWAQRPSPLDLLGIPGSLFGSVASALLAITALATFRHRGAAEGVRVLALIAVVAAAIAFLGSQLEPVWAPRYLAVLFGPLLLALAAVLSRGTRWTWLALAGVAGVWLVSGPAPAKSNVRTVAATVAPQIRPGDLVASTQPEQVPVLHRYLPGGVRFLTPLGVVADPRMTDWRDGVARLRAGRAERVLAPLVDRLAPGRRVLLVMPVNRRRSHAPWNRAVRIRTREWRAWLRADPRLRSIGRAPRSTFPPRRSAVRTQLFEVR
jgi:mannosyltransferase